MVLGPGSRIGRIRIDELIGAGGMGSVFRGWDERLERPVAVKAIHPNKLIDGGARSRFLREARLLSKLDHPNICRIYDVIEDESGSYLVLELIEGRTLRAAIAEGIDRPRAIQIALQVARVLAFAHGRGIIHRDLKPDNIMLTSAGEVKVLDFGLARLVQQEEEELVAPPGIGDAVTEEQTAIIARSPASSIDWMRTSAGTLVGTVHYMSPEQARGHPLSAASDLYSFGIVLFELISRGISPYGETPSTTELLSKVRNAEVDVPQSGDRDVLRLIRRLTAADPGSRPSAEETAGDLDRIGTRPQRRRRYALVAAAALLVIAIAAAAMMLTTRYGERTIFAVPGRGKIAVLPFHNDTHQRGFEWVELGLMDMVMQGLGGMPRVQLVPADDVLRAMKNLGIGRGAEIAPALRARLLDVLGADTLLAAAVTSPAGHYSIRYRLLLRDREDSPHEVESAAITDAANELAARLSRRLDPASQKIDIRDRYSFDDFANIAFAIGKQLYLTSGPKTAAPYLVVAIDRDPEFAWAKLQLAMCRQVEGDLPGADSLFEDAGKQAIRKGDRRLICSVDLARANAAIARGDYAAAESMASAALSTAQALGSLDLVGRLQNVLGVIAWHTNHPDVALARFNEAMKTFTAVRSLTDQAKVFNNYALLEADRGDNAAAERHYTQALQLAQRTNDQRTIANEYGNLALIAQSRGDLARAEELTRRQLTIARTIGDRGAEGIAMVNLAMDFYTRDRVPETVQLMQDAEKLAEQVHDLRVEGVALSNLVYLKTSMGELEAARLDLDKAEALSSILGNPDVTHRIYAVHGYWLTREGRLAEAETQIDNAEKLKVTGTSQVTRARLRYEQGQYARAAATIQHAMELKQGWFPAQRRMQDAFRESARTGRPATVPFEGAVH
ncbi:MAG: eukaryotic-like serine/threonine-protein kinase [Thermoanaerobaculia bacterium]|jgi:tetratricopeptide (TPR) repeat protein|nr:eukaryotic-like serine/threonine-protein kinase [Thermoanaerobaculia bacterium]